MNSLLIHECAIVVLLLHQFVFLEQPLDHTLTMGHMWFVLKKKMDLFNHEYYFNNSTT
jgi:hypothetical protein